jgi:hypothetical protein
LTNFALIPDVKTVKLILMDVLFRLLTSSAAKFTKTPHMAELNHDAKLLISSAMEGMMSDNPIDCHLQLWRAVTTRLGCF